MKKYRFYITETEKAKAELRTWAGVVNVCVADIIKQGYIDQYTNRPEYFANIIGANNYRGL